ncbi:MAG: 16S rRNA (cytidine(1402)-2'-O)-methyltransferase [Clostridiales bacterium]|nr:16S rRNA (cytidine(1402)-2'-O)-methyltransferase [Clostridiales bacterium]
MLYLAATPIGNLSDITGRVIDTLAACDAVFCEDTRRTGLLLSHLDIKKPLFSCHAHNEQARAEQLAEMLAEGKTVVYVSDAGMPGISDPGARLVAICVERGLPFTVLPGPSAVLTAAVLSGLPAAPFSFFGFLPRDKKGRAKILAQAANLPHLILFYESPRRVRATLAELHALLGDCPAAVLRELTKRFETAHRGTLSSLIAEFETEPKGECVIAVLPQARAATHSQEEIDVKLRALLAEHSVKDAAAIAAEIFDLPKKELYARALALRV